MKIRRLLAGGLFLLLLMGLLIPRLRTSAKTVRETQFLLGTAIEITVVDLNRGKAVAAISAAFAKMREIEKITNFYDPESDITQVNREAAYHPVKLSEDLWNIVEISYRYGALTEGAFDITVGPLTKLWGWESEYPQIPPPDEIKKVLPQVGYYLLDLNTQEKTLFFKKPGMLIDLGGVAKGYALEKAKEILKNYGIQNFLISAGQIVAQGLNPQKKPWIIGVQHPRDSQQFLTVINLTEGTIATSGDYQQFFEVNGIRYHHLLDPHIGWPVSLCQSVSVLEKDPVQADILSTALFVLGPEKGKKLVDELKIAAIIVDDRGEIHFTPYFPSEEAKK